MYIPNSPGLLVQNLKLLAYDINDANQVFRMQHEVLDESLYIKCHSQKLLIHTIHFLLGRICQDSYEEFETNFRIQQIKQFINSYPPRTQQEQIDYKKYFIDYLRKLEKTGRVPRSFNYCKAILDEKCGERLVKFLRFLSEFALRHQFMSQFPKKILKTLFIGLSLQNRKTHHNDLSDLFSTSSFQIEGLKGISLQRCQIDPNICEELCDLLRSQISNELAKLNRLFIKNLEYVRNVKTLVNFVEHHDEQVRVSFFDSEQQSQILRSNLGNRQLSKERQLDRIPAIDLHRKVLKDVSGLLRQCKNLKVDQQINRFNLDLDINDNLSSLGKGQFTDKVIDLIDINQIYKSVEQELRNGMKMLDQFQTQAWIKQSSRKMVMESEKTLENLKGFKNNKLSLSIK